ncbi:DUF4259 domain-containing protein [Hymenobacter rubripertinctus]|uniref:DUF4259 domain-containing protein n=1 Tax=Hymenobacter rubripertinctus TaxID=2029981 RepID=A0A418R947_9BACT|nr:DUF4259 domain-containing protein [Hymenobacter rubripertinctus]RIY13782.1 DUF4259 domain-containing protein [Hymenobacter rubripertinctus]
MALYNFDNDDAADFLADFADDPSEVQLLEALITAAEEENYLERDAAAVALIAAEIVAAWLGSPAPDFPADQLALTDELDVSDDDELTDLARRAVRAALAQSAKSELQELWQTSGQLPQWQAVQQDLLRRLEAQ